MKRFLLSFLVLGLLVCVIAVPSFAEGINYRDYEGSVKVEGDKDIVTIDLPVSWFHGLISMPDGTGVRHWDGHSVSYTIPYDTNRLNVYLAPFGTEIGAYNKPYTGRYLSMDNIPSDAEFYMQIGVTTDTPESFTVAKFQERVYAVNNDYASLYDIHEYPGGPAGSFAVSHVFDAVASEGWFPEFVMYVDSTSSSFLGRTLSVEVYNLQIEVSISSLYRLQEETGRSNELLTEVNRQLAEQGQTLDDVLAEQGATNDKLDNITDYVPEVDTPEGGEVVGDLEDVEDNVMDDVNDGFDKAEDIQLSVIETLLQYVTAFGVVSYIFDLFAWIPFFKVLLSVSLALGIVATLLNIGLSVSSGASKSKSDGKHGAKVKK